MRGTLFCTIWQAQPPQADDTADLLAPVPAVRTGSLVGYARVSTKGQLLDRQIHALTEARCIRIFSDKKSGKNAEREELWKALDYLREGDTLAVSSTASPRSSHRRFRTGFTHGLPGEPSRRRAVRFLHLPAPGDRMDALRSFMG
ncbi:recombinase family protein [Streptomyces sp. NPDC088190]|uniref:recombinase family protein n=1 Tax=unclassified Streptomyces TaxID=2593676 RepID=UPI0033DAB7E4